MPKEFIFSTLICFRIESCHWLTDLYFMRLVFWVVNSLALKRNLLPFIFHRWIRDLLHFFRTELNLIRCSAIEFCSVSSIINICTSCWSLWIYLKRNIALFVLCFIIERSFFLCILNPHRTLLRLNFICFVIIIVGSFQYIRVIMPLLNFISARLLSLWCDMISFVVMMRGSFSNKLDVFRWAVMFTLIMIKFYHMCIFDKDIFRCNTQISL